MKKYIGQSIFNRLLFLFALLVSHSNILLGQSMGKDSHYEMAFGYALTSEKLPEGYGYSPLFLISRGPIYQFASAKKSSFSIYYEPQLVWNMPTAPFKNSYEFGVNLGIQYFLPFSDKNGFSAAIGVGPHYLSLETAIQAKGFIFSDNFEVGYYQKLGQQWGVSIKSRFRHISNAGFLSPNLGIDNFFVFIGVFWKKE